MKSTYEVTLPWRITFARQVSGNVTESCQRYAADSAW